MLPKPGEVRPRWCNTPIPLSRFRRAAIGRAAYFTGWSLWLAAMPLPFVHLSSISSPSVPAPGTLPVLVMFIAAFGAFDLVEKINIWLRFLGMGYVVGVAAAAVFPAIRGRLHPRWAICWASAACAGLAAPWGFFCWRMAGDVRFLAVGFPISLLAHLFICTGIWLLVPPLSPNEKFTHRLRRWLREL